MLITLDGRPLEHMAALTGRDQVCPSKLKIGLTDVLRIDFAGLPAQRANCSSALLAGLLANAWPEHHHVRHRSETCNRGHAVTDLDPSIPAAVMSPPRSTKPASGLTLFIPDSSGMCHHSQRTGT